MTRGARSLLVAVAALIAVGGAAPRRAGARTSLGEVVKISRMLEEGQIEDAEPLIAQLQKTAPNEPETRFLVAQLAFLQGDYARAKKLLAEIKDPRSRALVDELAMLVDGTEEATRGFQSRESSGGHFVIFFQPGKDEAIVDWAGDALEAAYTRIGDDLGYKPARKVRVELLPHIDDLAKTSTLTVKDLETSGTIALCKYNKLMVVTPRATLFGYPWMDTMAHEYTHFVVTRASHDKVTIWLQEGLAKFEERRWRLEPNELTMEPGLARFLAGAVKKGRLVTFEQMYPSMAKLPSQEAAQTAFAEVYSIVAWMHGKVGYDGLRQVIAKIKDGKSERRAVGEVLGKPWDDVEAEWKKSLRDGGGAGAAGVGQGAGAGAAASGGKKIRFKKDPSKDTGDDVGLEEIPSEKARGYARLGGTLRARGRLAAAAVEYEKALGLAPGSPMISARLARTYLELGDSKKAIEVATPAADKDPEDAGAQATLGVAYAQSGDDEQAEGHLLAALRISPFDPAIRCGLADVYGRRGKSDLAAREGDACRKLRK